MNTISKWVKIINFENCIKIDNYYNKSKFVKICDIILDNELTIYGNKKRKTLIKLNSIEPNIDINEVTEWCYIFTINGNIIKIGGTRTGIKNRFISYLCGSQTIENGKSGKSSVTNNVIYNTFHHYLTKDHKIEMYGYKLPEHIILIENIPEKIQSYHIYESRLINEFKEKYGIFPVLSLNKDPNK
jgi:ribonuclease BN (tRNA processing enzyme)